MKIRKVNTKKDLKDFCEISKKIYKDMPCFRSTEDEVMYLLIKGPSAFHKHASVRSYIALEEDEPVARFSLIRDSKLPDYVQISFFEALPGLPELINTIINEIRISFPGSKKIIFGLNGHLNYGAGILLNRFDKAPVFGLPYTPEYYQDYFKDFNKRTLVSYRFPTEPFFNYQKRLKDKLDFKGITVRTMNKKRLRREVEIYTYLNNTCFPGHPYWADRDVEEDYELFHPFRFLIKEENLLFAERAGEPIGFFLWYPDFNQLVKGDQRLGIRHVLQYHFANPIDTFRFTEIAVLPKYKVSPTVQAMILHATPYIKKSGYKYGEGGYIFEENKASIAMTMRFLARATGQKFEPYRRYAVFEGEI